MSQGKWFASGKERTPGNLIKYAFTVLTAVVFAGISLLNLLLTGGDVMKSLLQGLIYAVATAIVGIIVYFLYTKVIAKPKA